MSLSHASLLETGTSIRKLRPDEEGLFRDFLLGLDAGSRRDRFCGAVSDTFLREHAGRSFAAGTLLHGCFVGGRLRAVAELSDAAPGEVAEAAFTVEPSLRNRGIGSALLDATMLAARNRGYPAVRVICLRSNLAMRRLAQKAQADLMLTFDEMHGEIRPPRATMLSRYREAVTDTMEGFSRLLRPPQPAPRRA